MAVNSLDLTQLNAGRQLRLRRTILGLSQAKVAVAAGLTVERVSEAERGAESGRTAHVVEALQTQVDAALTKLERRAHAVAEAMRAIV